MATSSISMINFDFVLYKGDEVLSYLVISHAGLVLECGDFYKIGEKLVFVEQIMSIPGEHIINGVMCQQLSDNTMIELGV